ncbi:MAG: hypothetical protein ACRDP9_31040, partial [Kribbellaceae bacterium]
MALLLLAAVHLLLAIVPGIPVLRCLLSLCRPWVLPVAICLVLQICVLTVAGRLVVALSPHAGLSRIVLRAGQVSPGVGTRRRPALA